MTCGIYMPLPCMGSVLKLCRIPQVSTEGDNATSSQSLETVAGACDTGSQCGPLHPLKRHLIKAGRGPDGAARPHSHFCFLFLPSWLPPPSRRRGLWESKAPWCSATRAPNRIRSPLKIRMGLRSPSASLICPEDPHPHALLSINVIKGRTKSFLSPAL